MKSNLSKYNATIADLLMVEKQTGIKHELIDGELYMMTGGTGKHSVICANLSYLLKDIFKDKDCLIFNSDFKLKVTTDTNDNYYYPDVSVKCSKINLNDIEYENPTLLVEVLSDSSIRRDRITKLNDYLRIKGLMGYLIVSQKSKQIELWKSLDDVKTFGSNEVVKIEKNIEFKLDDVYLNTTM